MNRRDFVRLLLGTAIAATVDVEQLLWTPQTIITVPAMPSEVSLDKLALIREMMKEAMTELRGQIDAKLFAVYDPYTIYDPYLIKELSKWT